MTDGFREITLTDPEQGRILLLIAIPIGEDPWGCLAPLRGTAWESQVQVVTGEALSHALHGWATPLMREIGQAPYVRAGRIPTEEGRCTLFEVCPGASPFCRPGRKTPDCYEAEVPIAVRVTLAWREGRYVVVVQGPEFV